MRSWLRARPWVWIVVLYAAVLTVNVLVAVIAGWNAPVDVK
jgi:hypothetical protein